MLTRVDKGRAALLGVVLALIGVVAACTAGPFPGPGGAQPPRPDNRPNIVFVLTDDLSDNLLQFMPNVRALQRAGSSFANDFVIDSFCCPSRSAIFTGEYPHDDGVFTNTPPDGGYSAYNQHNNPPNSFAVALQESGYRTGFYGKYLNGYRPTDRPARGWDQWHAAGNGYAEYNYRLRDNATITNHGHRPADYLTNVLAQKASRFVGSSSRSGKPFMLEIAPFAPHQPATPAPQDAQKFTRLKAPRTASFNKRVANAPRWLATIPALSKKELAEADRNYQRRARSVLAVDRMVGQLRRQLKRLGEADNTYFVFSSDNSYHIGEHQLRPGKQTAFDTDIKVPLVVAGPGVPAGRTVRAMTASIDLCPTFEAIGGVKPGPRVDGVSMLGLWHGQRPKNWQRAVLIEHHNSDGRNSSDPDYQANRHGDPPDYEAVRTTTALYVEYSDGEREYYDLTRDPNELVNIAGKLPKPKLAAIATTLHALERCHTSGACQRAARR